jgi:exopolysaccharide biosynthesis polyprenyl glycosylphosphotransferase
MGWARHRQSLLAAAGLDAAGLCGIAVAITKLQGLAPTTLHNTDLLLLTLIYLSCGWLFGSYTLLKLRDISWAPSLKRLGITSIASILIVSSVGSLFKFQPTNGLFIPSSLISLFAVLGVWSAGVRHLLRHNPSSSRQPQWKIIATIGELDDIKEKLAPSESENVVEISTSLDQSLTSSIGDQILSLAISPGILSNQTIESDYQKAINQGIPIYSLMQLAEQEIQRIPSRWIGDQWILFSDRIDGLQITTQKQFKRYADVVISASLLVLTSPFTLTAGLLIKLQDGGPVFFKQQRSGLLGQPFEILKLRTMAPSAEAEGAMWSVPNDQRITTVGRWLRKSRIDELPQLINVLRGEMSLIGPRPEQPELEVSLEEKIPNYRMRHWIRPGISGWAQVNMPYASNLKDAELKLSYDLYYLRNGSVWLDLLILFKTIKVVLKASGR